jgi:pyruvate dehydrogenase E1 component alpha subunit
MKLANAVSPTARRAILSDRLEQLVRMIEIRTVEERIQKLYVGGEVRGSTHLCSGQEAVAVGLARATRADDVVACTYRGHGHALALGVTPVQVIGEICGRTVGCAGGLGGSMHLVEPDVGLSGDLERMRSEVKESVEEAVSEVLAAPQPGEIEILSHVTA